MWHKRWCTNYSESMAATRLANGRRTTKSIAAVLVADTLPFAHHGHLPHHRRWGIRIEQEVNVGGDWRVSGMDDKGIELQ